MPATKTKRHGGKDSYAGPYDGDNKDWKSRKVSTRTNTKSFMVPADSNPKETFDAIAESLGDIAYRVKITKANAGASVKPNRKAKK